MFLKLLCSKLNLVGCRDGCRGGAWREHLRSQDGGLRSEREIRVIPVWSEVTISEDEGFLHAISHRRPDVV